MAHFVLALFISPLFLICIYTVISVKKRYTVIRDTMMDADFIEGVLQERYYGDRGLYQRIHGEIFVDTEDV